MINHTKNVQGSAHGIHIRQKFVLYRDSCLQVLKVEYDQIGGVVDGNWHPFRLQAIKRD